jgi:hypothetical protein
LRSICLGPRTKRKCVPGQNDKKCHYPTFQ